MVCLVDERVGDMKWGDLRFAMFSSCFLELRACDVVAGSAGRLDTLLDLAVISANVPVLTDIDELMMTLR